MRDAPDISASAEQLLDWYDRHARQMPWRIGPNERRVGVRPDPYRVWLSEVMLQQTTVAAVKGYFLTFTDRWPTVHDLASTQDDEVMAAWAGLGYYARARNLLKCARTVSSDLDGVFPDTVEGLRALPGIGPYTAGAIAAIAFDVPAPVVDGNVERVMARLFAVKTPLPAAKAELTDLAAGLTPQERPGDYAQAVMDLGATLCTPRAPACGICPWRDPCAGRQGGFAADLPRKTPKAKKPLRKGFAYLARHRNGAWLLERRPDKGLLGGMLGWPCSDWSEAPVEAPPVDTLWHDTGLEVRHTFTHFHLRLALRVAWVEDSAPPPTLGCYHPAEDFDPGALPTVMRKAHDLASFWFSGN